MKYIFIILFFFKISDISAQDNLIKKLDMLITSWHEAASKADINAYFNLMSDNSVFIGTDSTEYWTKAEFYLWAKPYFDRGKAWTLKANSRHIYLAANNKFAWWDELIYTSSGTWIGTGILEKVGKEWKIRHYTLSVTIPNPKMKAVAELLKQ